MPILNRYSAVLVLLLFTLLCTYRGNPVHPRSNPFDAGGVNWVYRDTATIYTIDGVTGAADAVVKVFAVGATDTTPFLTDTTDQRGGFTIRSLPTGVYTLLVCKDSLTLFRDSLIIAQDYTTLRDATLEYPSSLSGILSPAFYGSDTAVKLYLPGTGRPPLTIDTSGNFTLTGLSSGTWPLLIATGLSDDSLVYLPVFVPRATDVRIADTLRPGYTSVPPSIGTYHVFYGMLHNHSILSDGTGTPAEAYRYARDRAGLDFFSLADHGYSLTPDTWEIMRVAADEANDDDHFTAFRGFEWTSNRFGHYSVIATEEYCSIIDSATATLTGFFHWLSEGNGVAFINHPYDYTADGIFNHYTGPPPDNIVGMELWNKTSGFEVFYYNDGYYSNDNYKSYYDEVLSIGWHIGAGGSDDNHHATWGTRSDYRLAVLAHRRTREDILTALRNRRFYSTMDKNLHFSFTIDGNEMGSTVTGTNHRLTVQATDGGYEQFNEVKMYDKRHEVVKKWDIDTCTIKLSCEVTTEKDEYFYVIVRQADGDEAISSPVWVSTIGE